MNTKDFLKIAGVKSEKEFYEKFPTEEAFFEAYPQADMYRKGGKLKKKKQDPAHGYREFPPNVMAMGGGLVNMMQGGGSIPNMPLAQEGMESTAQSGYISPYNESQFNVTGQAKKTGNVMSRGENVGWTIADVVWDFFKPIHGQQTNLSEMTGKVNPYNAKQGSWWKTQGGGGGMNSNIMNKMMSGGKGGDKNPTGGTAPGAGPGAEDLTTGMGMGNSMGSTMVKYGGPLKMNMGGQMMPGMTAINSEEPYGNPLRQYGGPLKMEIGGPMPSSMGLNELTGPTHEQGGMAISPEVEVEGGETILEPASYVYSDSILVPGTKKTFAQASKAVKNKYKMREDDKLSQEAMNSELEALMNQQEEVKESMMIADTEKFQNKMMAKYGGLMPDMGYPVDRNMQPIEMRKGGGIYIKPSKRGTFTAAAKKRGMGVQEFASKVMANKEDYSSAMVKKANFAKNAAKWKKQFGGFIEDEEMYGPVMMGNGGGIDPLVQNSGLYKLNSDLPNMDLDYMASIALEKESDNPENKMELTNLLVNSPYYEELYKEDASSLDPDKGRQMRLKRAQKMAAHQKDSKLLKDPSKYENITISGNQLLLENEPGEFLGFKNERDARRFLNTLKSGKLDSYIKNDFEDTDDNKEKKKFDFNKFRMATTGIAGAAAAAKGLLGKNRFQNIPPATVNYINTRPADVLAERQGELALAAGLGGLRDNATTQGNYLANVANLAAASGIGTGSNVANIRFQGDTQNLGIANQAALQRQATIAQNIDRLEKFRTAELLRRDKMADDFSRIAQTAGLDRQKLLQQDLILKGLQTGDFKFDRNGELYYKSTEDGVETWKPAYT